MHYYFLIIWIISIRIFRLHVKKKLMGSYVFLDVLIKNINTKFETSVFRKKTFTGLLANFLSCMPFVYKLTLIKTWINRIYHICNNWKVLHENLKELKLILNKKFFPPNLIDTTIKTYLQENISKIENVKENENNDTYFKLPYVGEYSGYVSRKIKMLCKQFWKRTEVKLSFSMAKTGDLFSAKSGIPSYISNLLSFIILNVLAVMPVMWVKRQDIWMLGYTNI